MKTYQYQLIRYMHDQFTGEFLNLGVVVLSPENQFLDCKVVTMYHRLNNFFPQANGRLVIRILKHFKNEIKLVSEKLGELFQPIDNLANITNRILPKDDSAIYLSEVKVAIDIDLGAALDDLYRDMVGKYLIKPENTNTLTDEDVWKTKYKKYFDQYKISNHLVKHEIATSNDVFTFDKSWKNEIWHCYEPVSFALKNSDSIKDKVYKWAGRIQGIQQSNDEVQLYLLSSLNPHHRSLNSFIKSYLLVSTPKLKVNIIMDTEAEKIAKEVSVAISEHQNDGTK